MRAAESLRQYLESHPQGVDDADAVLILQWVDAAERRPNGLAARLFERSIHRAGVRPDASGSYAAIDWSKFLDSLLPILLKILPIILALI